MRRHSAYGLDAGREVDWRQDGACRDWDPDLFTSPNDADLGQARWICLNLCTVIDQCLDWARQHPDLAGPAVYGGLYLRRPAGEQPEAIRPTGRPARRRPEIKARAQDLLGPHLDEIRALVESGASAASIGRLYGCSDDAVGDFLRRHGVRRPERAP